MLLWTLGCMYLFKLLSLFFSDIYPGMELLGHMVVLFLVFWETSILFSTVVHQFTFPSTVYKGSLFSTSSQTFVIFWWYPFWQVWGGISLWFWFAFPWWLVMLSTFSCSSWSSAFPFWDSVYSVLLPIF